MRTVYNDKLDTIEEKLNLVLCKLRDLPQNDFSIRTINKMIYNNDTTAYIGVVFYIEMLGRIRKVKVNGLSNQVTRIEEIIKQIYNRLLQLKEIINTNKLDVSIQELEKTIPENTNLQNTTSLKQNVNLKTDDKPISVKLSDIESTNKDGLVRDLISKLKKVTPEHKKVKYPLNLTYVLNSDGSATYKLYMEKGGRTMSRELIKKLKLIRDGKNWKFEDDKLEFQL